MSSSSFLLLFAIVLSVSQTTVGDILVYSLVSLFFMLFNSFLIILSHSSSERRYLKMLLKICLQHLVRLFLLKGYEDR